MRGEDGHEHERFRALVEHLADPILVVDGDHRLSYASPAVEALLGHPPDDLVGRPVRSVLSFDGLDDRWSERSVLELEARHRDGQQRHVEATLAGALDDPRTGGLVLSLRDVTARKSTLVEMRQSEEWAHALLQGGSDTVMVTDADGVIYYVSPGVVPMLGYEPTELVGRSCFELLDPNQYDEALAEWIELESPEIDPYPVSLRVCHADGSWRYVEVVGRNLLDDPAVRGMVITARDVTERMHAEEALRRSEEWAQALVQGGSDIVCVTDSDGTILYISPAAEAIMGYTPGELLDTNTLELVHPDDLERGRATFLEALEGRSTSSPTRLRVRHRNGGWLQMSMLFTDMLRHRAVRGVVINARDITGRWEAEQLLARQAQALEAVARGAPLDTTLYRIAQILEQRWPDASCAVGVRGDDGAIKIRAAPGLDRQTVVALDGVEPDSELGAAVRAGGRGPVVFTQTARDRRWTEVLQRAPRLARHTCWSQLVIRPGSRDVLGAMLVFLPEHRVPNQDETELLDRLMYLAAVAIERRNFEAALEHQALHDDLTDLPNRTLLLDRIAQALARARRYDGHVAVLFVDLDRFKVINDSLGHATGDRLLAEVAERLRAPLRLGDTLGRLGGDEFVVVCERVEDEAEAVGIAERLAQQLSSPFHLGEVEVAVTASIGVAISGDRAMPADSLIRNADMAMYQAKERGRDRLAVFEEDLAQRAHERHELEQSLRTALDEDQFVLHYQPLIRLADGGVTGAEALARWDRPGRGLVEPAAFIPLAEETGLILPIGTWVIEEACRATASWPLLPDGNPMQMTVNLSARQLDEPRTLELIAAALERHDLRPDQLCLEITESVLFDQIDTAISTVERLKALGVRIAIDDFGTGYATLEYLRRFSMADYLKIDRSFVEGVDSGGSKETAIVAGAIALAKSLDFVVVAEGVQTEGQLTALRGLGCDLAQGFYFARPMPAGDAMEVLARGRTG